MSRSRAVRWDICEEHLDEAAFLWDRGERALNAPNYAIGEVAVGPEERLLAHLDGLVLGGQPVADKLLLPALGDDHDPYPTGVIGIATSSNEVLGLKPIHDVREAGLRGEHPIAELVHAQPLLRAGDQVRQHLARRRVGQGLVGRRGPVQGDLARVRPLRARDVGNG